MAAKQAYGPLKFGKISDKKFDEYVKAVQLAAGKDYTKMEELITFIFPG